MNVTAPKSTLDQISALLGSLGYDTDGPGWGPTTIKRLGEFADAAEAGEVTVAVAAAQNASVHAVLASSFADPADVAAFKAVKARGLSDEEAFKYGDNGIGEWGDSTVEGTGPACALPPEDWQHLAHPRGTPVNVTLDGVTVTALLKDSMPHKANITNGCGLDMSPDLCAALGVRPGGEWHVTWQWA